MDKVSLQRIEKLHPYVREEVKQIVKECDEALTGKAKIRITQGLRSFEEQEKLYAIGRITSGKKVTNAKAGQSIHNYGLAFDIVILLDKDNNGTFESVSWDIDKYWMRVVNFFKSKGWTWGGDFKSLYDAPHFEYTQGKTWKYYSKMDIYQQEMI